MAQARPGAAVAAVVLALMVLAPALANVQAAVDALADDLASGEFHPFGKPFASSDDPSRAVWDDAVGGLTGESNGGFTAGVANLPDVWPMDRDGAAGRVTIDYVFDPALGAMKRLKAFDRVADDYALEVAEPELRSAFEAGPSTVDTTFRGSFPVRVNPERPVPIFSPSPDARIVADSVQTDPPVAVRFLKDGADTFYIVSESYTGVVTLNLTYEASRAYFVGGIPRGIHPGDYAAGDRPSAPEGARQRAPLVLARAGLDGDEDLAATVTGLAVYFRAFGEDAIPQPDEVADLYEALALGENGCCRHRAFAFVTTLHALGYPARVVANEAHAYAEVKLPGKVNAWRQVNLGGCGTYEVNNPRDVEVYPGVGPQADEPERRPPDAEQGEPTQVVRTEMSLTDAPARLVKGGPGVALEGSVTALVEGRRSPLRDAPVDVYLNRTDSPLGVLVATGRTELNGQFRLAGHLTPHLAPGEYELVAHARGFRLDQTLYTESWDRAPTILWTATRLNLTPLATEGQGVPVPIEGRLVDAADRGVPGAILTLAVDGRNVSLETDAEGRFSHEVTFNALGGHDLTVDYAGDPFHGSARETTRVTIVEATVLVDAPTRAVRDEDWPFKGRVLSGARGVPGVAVTVDASWSDAPLVLATDDEGRFTGTLPVPRRLDLGAATIAFTADPPGAHRDVPLDVVRGVTLTVDAPDRIAPGEIATFRVTVLADTDAGDTAPLSGARLNLGLGNRATVLRAATDATGTATFTVAPEALGLDAGRLDWRVNYGGGDDLATADAAGTLLVGSPAGSLPPALAWAAGLGAPLLLGAAAYGWRRHGTRMPTPLWVRRLAARRPGYRFSLDSPGRTGSLPPTWAPGEPVRLTLRALRVHDGVAAPAAGLRLRVRIAGHGEWKVRLDDEGHHELTLDPLPEGTHPVELRAGRHRDRVTLRIAPYGHAIERAWLLNRRALRDHGAPLAPGATPREVAAALTNAGADAEAADRAATLYEAAEYAPDHATRDDFEAFLRALHAARTGAGIPGGDRPDE